MTFNELIEYNYDDLAALFKRAVKLYEDTQHTHLNYQRHKMTKYNIAEYLRMLSETFWAPYTIEKGFDLNHQLKIPFSSLEELELKLTIRGY